MVSNGYQLFMKSYNRTVTLIVVLQKLKFLCFQTMVDSHNAKWLDQFIHN